MNPALLVYRAREASEEAVRLARELDDDRLLLAALNNQALALLLVERHGEKDAEGGARPGML